MKLSRVAGALGAEVTDFDVSAALAKGEGQGIRDLLNEHEVLFFRSQQLKPASRAMARRSSVHSKHTQPMARSIIFLRLCSLKARPRIPRKSRCGIRI